MYRYVAMSVTIPRASRGHSNLAGHLPAKSPSIDKSTATKQQSVTVWWCAVCSRSSPFSTEDENRGLVTPYGSRTVDEPRTTNRFQEPVPGSSQMCSHVMPYICAKALNCRT